ncbi:MAG: tRNA 2-thiouridine(34) synthase MnmA [Methylocystaceae bacterium]
MSKQRVMVAMSGGVDSSVAAYLLLKAGYEVCGATLQIWQLEQKQCGSCCGNEAVDDAREVARKLGIPHYVLNYRQEFAEKVIDFFCAEYLKGRTPNPCIACNRHIKFGGMLDQARAIDMDFLATGHYARIKQDDARRRYLLYQGLDKRKDQSYVLYNLEQEQLKHLLLPLGDYSKPQIREIAHEIGLAVADKPESQEICFIPDNDYGAFVKNRRPDALQPGTIEETNGNILGYHQGIANFTIGQRKGLGLAAGRPLYVVAIDADRRAVIVGDNQEVFAGYCLAEDMNWITIPELQSALEVEAKIRYTAPPAPAVITPTADGVEVKFVNPVRAITPGQAIVFYQGDLVIGGGTIKQVRR